MLSQNETDGLFGHATDGLCYAALPVDAAERPRRNAKRDTQFPEFLTLREKFAALKYIKDCKKIIVPA